MIWSVSETLQRNTEHACKLRSFEMWDTGAPGEATQSSQGWCRVPVGDTDGVFRTTEFCLPVTKHTRPVSR